MKKLHERLITAAGIAEEQCFAIKLHMDRHVAFDVDTSQYRLNDHVSLDVINHGN